jgi:hypothetical protein
MVDPQRNPATGRRTFYIFFFAVWFLACFYHLGDLGPYSDDWSLAAIDPITHAPIWGAYPLERNYFWRPLLQLFLHYAFLLTWHHLWIFHFANVACHGAIALGVMKLSRKLGFSRSAAGASGLVFLLFPFQYEVIFWCTAITTAIPAGLMVVLCCFVLRYARAPRVWHLPAFAALTFFTVCWYEQPCAIAAGFPFLYLAGRDRAEGWRTSLVRIIGVLLACGIPMIIYITLLATTAPATARGGAGSFIGASELSARLAELRSAMGWYFGPRLAGAFSGGLQTGMNTIATPLGACIAAGVAIVGGMWAARAVGPSRPVQSVQESDDGNINFADRTRRIYGTLFAIVATGAVWLPIVPIRGQILEARLSYCMCIGLGLLVAACITGLEIAIARFRAPPRSHIAVRIAIVMAAWVGALSLLGWQTVIRTRIAADTAQTARLAERFPNVSPGTVFMLMRDDYRAGRTGLLTFDWPPLGWTSASWSATPALRYALRRNDIAATTYNIWIPPAFKDITSTTITYTGSLVPIDGAPYPEGNGGLLLPWDRIVPYITTPTGEAQPVGQIEFVFTSGAPPIIINPPLTAGEPARAVVTITDR